MRNILNLKIIHNNDRDIYHNSNRVNRIVDLLIIDDTVLYKEVINVINNIYNLRDFMGHIHSLLNLYSHPELSDKLGVYITFLYQIYNDKRNCANLRGAVLERLVYKLLINKYRTECESHISCYICINSWKSQKTVDVLFYMAPNDIGESFECKVNPAKFEKEHIDNLRQIFIKSNRKIYPNVVSFSSKKALEWRVKEFKAPIEPVKLFGFENLKEIATRTLSIPTKS